MGVLYEFSRQWAVLWALISNTWWLWLPVGLFFFGKSLWRDYLKTRYFSTLSWVLLEVRIPRTIAKTPEAMEQVFAGLQGMYWEFDPWEVWWEGLQHDYVVFELASMGGETKFYVRTPMFFRNAVESQIYAQYPEGEIVEVEDYLDLLPEGVPNEEWDVFGVEFKLEKEDAYPIRTYRDFMAMAPNQEEFTKVDPFSSLVELLGKLRPGEHLGYHLLLRPAQTPTPDAWKKKGEEVVEKLIGKRVTPKKGMVSKAIEPFGPVVQGWGRPLAPLFGVEPSKSAPEKREERGEPSLMQYLSPGTKTVVESIERNILKPGFDVFVRMCYVARRDVFSLSHIASFVGALKTYNTLTLNGFKLNSTTLATRTAWWLPSFITRGIKQHKRSLYYQYYRARKPFTDTWTLKSQQIVLNTEELATIFHYPGMTAKAPMLPRIEARRSEPPAALPVG